MKFIMVIPYLIASIFVVFFCVIISLLFTPDVSMTLLLFISFILFVTIFHIIAYVFSKNGIPIQYLKIIEYIYLTMAVFSLSGIFLIESEWDKRRAQNLEPYLNRLEKDIMSRIDWSISHYSSWSADSEVYGHKAGDLTNWFNNLKKNLNNDSDIKKLQEFITTNKNKFQDPPNYDVSIVLKWLHEYIVHKKDQERLFGISNKGLFFYIKYFSFWALAFSLALRMTKLTIEYKNWLLTT